MKPYGYEPFAHLLRPYLPCPAALSNKGLVWGAPQEPIMVEMQSVVYGLSVLLSENAYNMRLTTPTYRSGR